MQVNGIAEVASLFAVAGYRRRKTMISQCIRAEGTNY